MSYKIKIVIAVLNIMCLFASIVFPNDTTPFAILITIISVASWAFSTYANSTVEKICQVVYVIAVSLTAAFCFIIGITTKVGKADIAGNLITEATQSFDHYVLVVSNEAFIFPGKTFPYNGFAFGAIAVVSTFMLIEILATAVRRSPHGNSGIEITEQGHAPSIATMIDWEIGHIR